jgi:hypothetical protein
LISRSCVVLPKWPSEQRLTVGGYQRKCRRRSSTLSKVPSSSWACRECRHVPAPALLGYRRPSVFAVFVSSLAAWPFVPLCSLAGVSALALTPASSLLFCCAPSVRKSPTRAGSHRRAWHHLGWPTGGDNASGSCRKSALYKARAHQSVCFAKGRPRGPDFCAPARSGRYAGGTSGRMSSVYFFRCRTLSALSCSRPN